MSPSQSETFVTNKSVCTLTQVGEVFVYPDIIYHDQCLSGCQKDIRLYTFFYLTYQNISPI